MADSDPMDPTSFSTTPPAAPLSACQCARCGDERWSAAHPGKQPTPFNGPPSMTTMVLCAICGNKRCPHATDHRHACTGSNEPGQPGSSYGPPITAKEPVSDEDHHGRVPVKDELERWLDWQLAKANRDHVAGIDMGMLGKLCREEPDEATKREVADMMDTIRWSEVGK